MEIYKIFIKLYYKYFFTFLKFNVMQANLLFSSLLRHSAKVLFLFVLQMIQYSQAENIKLIRDNRDDKEALIKHFPIVNDDTIPQEGDTIAIYTSGLDTTYIVYFEEIPDSLAENAWVINDPNKKMIIELSHHSAPVNTGVIGINLTDFFEDGHGNPVDNENYEVVPDPWQALIDLAPKTIRVFSGASAKFMHPLGSYDPIEDIGYAGYGYNWKEMITYFDITNPGLAPDDGLGGFDYSIIETQLSTSDIAGLSEWVDDKLAGRFVEFYEKCMKQPQYDPIYEDTPEERDLYINMLIDLIHMIQDDEDNDGLIVDVIYCVNIESQSASEVRDVLNYLIDNDINIVGVELGNEVAGRFGEKAMGFEDFEHYWKFINGEDYDGLTGDYSTTDLEYALQDGMEADHDFIAAIKGNTDLYTIKIGLPAMNTPDCGQLYDFPLMPPFDPDNEPDQLLATTPVLMDPDPGVDDIDDDCDCFYPQWNLDMVNYYDETTTETTYEHPSFDAIVFHTYYTTSNATDECEVNGNWQNIMLSLHDEFDPAHLSDVAIDPFEYTTTEWDYSPTDTRLDDAFNGISGVHFPDADDDLLTGNFKEFTRDRIDNSFTEHSEWMQFTDSDTDPEDKEVWVTEYNLDDGVQLPAGDYADDNADIFQNFASSVDNTFSHAAMLQNWFLYQLKVNYDPDYRDLFLTRATVQNLLGGSPTMMMTNSDVADQVKLLEISSCYTDEVTPYYVRRATYYAVELWKAIQLNDLKYLKTETTMASLNNNLAPTVFIDDDPISPMLYIYYTNVTNDVQWYGIAPGDIVEMLVDPPLNPYDYEVTLETDIDAVILDADQLYSTAGSAPLFKINDEYSTCSDEVDNANRFELTDLDLYGYANVSCPGPFTAGAPGGVCVELPAISMGYFTIPITVTELRKGNPNDLFAIYPNPTANYFILQQKDISKDDIESMTVSIYSIFGTLEKNVQVSEGQSISVTELPVGVYNIVIQTGLNNIESEMLVKMK